VLEISGTLEGTVVAWTDSVDVHVTGDLVVPAGSRLEVREGTRVLFASRANLIVEGELVIAGTREAPVLFASRSAAEPWGGVVIDRGTMTAEHAFFVNAGADETRAFSHSNSQAVLYFGSADGTLSHVYLMDNVGKGIGGTSSVVRFDRGLITRSDTGGEVHYGVTRISNSHILEIPNADGVPVDDDNDGFYFFEAHRELDDFSRVERTFVMVGKDDAIDHNHAKLEIVGSWLEGFAHECVAGSSGNEVRILSSVLRDCEQGVEAGYGAPTVVVDHSVIVDNRVGVRFGDSYTNPLDGHITVTNSILFGNEDDVLNLDMSSGGPVPGAITLMQTLANDTDTAGCSGCIGGEPQFDDGYFLMSGSPGTGAASDGSDLGLVRDAWD
ncbi:MAG TPA: hypothetical protein VF190_12965, partial [Rhodothermales bacterium]